MEIGKVEYDSEKRNSSYGPGTKKKADLTDKVNGWLGNRLTRGQVNTLLVFFSIVVIALAIYIYQSNHIPQPVPAIESAASKSL